MQDLGATVLEEDEDMVFMQGPVYIEKYPMSHIVLTFLDDRLLGMMMMDNAKDEHPEMWEAYLQKFQGWYGNNLRTIYEDKVAFSLIESTLVDFGASKDDVLSYVDDETMLVLITTPSVGLVCFYDLVEAKKEMAANLEAFSRAGSGTMPQVEGCTFGSSMSEVLPIVTKLHGKPDTQDEKSIQYSNVLFEGHHYQYGVYSFLPNSSTNRPELSSISFLNSYVTEDEELARQQFELLVSDYASKFEVVERRVDLPNHKIYLYGLSSGLFPMSLTLNTKEVRGKLRWNVIVAYFSYEHMQKILNL